MDFELLSLISDVQVIAKGHGIRELARLRRDYGVASWRKLKGVADVRLVTGVIRRVELHWYQAHGIGKVEFKIKAYLDETP